MFKSSKSGVFESKVAKFALEHVDGSRKGKQANTKLGSASLDLAAYATVDMSSSNVKLSFLDGRVTLRMTLCSHWLKNLAVDATSDDSSVASFCTDGESDAGAAAEEAGGGRGVVRHRVERAEQLQPQVGVDGFGERGAYRARAERGGDC